jgi:hypothetical protein
MTTIVMNKEGPQPFVSLKLSSVVGTYLLIHLHTNMLIDYIQNNINTLFTNQNTYLVNIESKPQKKFMSTEFSVTLVDELLDE